MRERRCLFNQREKMRNKEGGWLGVDRESERKFFHMLAPKKVSPAKRGHNVLVKRKRQLHDGCCVKQHEQIIAVKNVSLIN